MPPQLSTKIGTTCIVGELLSTNKYTSSHVSGHSLLFVLKAKEEKLSFALDSKFVNSSQ